MASFMSAFKRGLHVDVFVTTIPIFGLLSNSNNSFSVVQRQPLAFAKHEVISTPQKNIFLKIFTFKKKKQTSKKNFFSSILASLCCFFKNSKFVFILKKKLLFIVFFL